ncbi:MAG: hypothetical protein E7551_06345 [Ruminococcaceae bacterium]|nr:hypothetical protein [Oscillospiraceae bacterium]
MDFAKILSVTSVVLAALWLVLPRGKSANGFKYAMGLFVISVIISILGGLDFSLPEKLQTSNSTTVTNTAQSISNDTAVYVIENLLKKCNIKFGEIQIITDNSENSDINITKAYVELEPKDFERAAEIIKNQTGIILTEGG